MKFLPLENITYKTRLKEEEIINRLSDNTEYEKKVRFPFFNAGYNKTYEGEVGVETFSIKRIIGYRNSFLPRINGVIERDFNGVKIDVKMRLPTYVIVFLCFWCGIVGFVSIVTLPKALGEPEFNPEALVPVGMLFFSYAVTMGAFKYESNKSKKDLQKMFEAEIIDQ